MKKIKKRIIQASILTGCLFLALIPNGVSTEIAPTVKSTITVDNEGDGDYTTIQAAINSASNGDTIEVYSGVYPENVILNVEGIALIGINMELGTGTDTGYPVIDGGGSDDVLTIQRDDGVIFEDAVVSYFMITGTGTTSDAGIRIYLARDIEISYNEIYECNIGMFIDSVDTCEIKFNTIEDNRWGITMVNCDHNQIIENIIHYNNRSGIKLENCPDNSISLNTIQKNAQIGLFLKYSYRNRIQQNDFIDNGEENEDPTKRRTHVAFTNGQNSFSDNHWSPHKVVNGIPGLVYVIWGQYFSTFIPFIKIPYPQFDWRPS
jgi:parallel beta-helix repeat protein